MPVDQWTSPITIEVQTAEKASAGKFSFELRAKLLSYPSVAPAATPISLEVLAPTANKKPYFASSLPSPLTVQMTTVPKSWSYKLPEIKDDDSSGELTVKVDLGSASGFLSFSANSLEIGDISDTEKVKPLSYFLKVTISDSVD